MNPRKRSWLILFALAAIAAIVILASGLQDLDLSYDGQSLPTMPREEGPVSTPDREAGRFDLLVRGFFIVAGAILPFAIILYLASPGARKRLLRDFIALFVLLVPLYLLWRAQPGNLGTEGSDISLPQAAPESLPPAPQVAFEPQPGQWLSVFATIGIALLGAALLVGLAWTIWRRRQRPPTALDELGHQAQDAIDAIEAGADLKDTVMQCYLEMMQVMKEERGIQRQQAMTPREFEARLEEAGIPTTQVRRLTRLFEEVRYGDRHLGEQEQRQAIISLTSIVRFCRSAS